MKRSEINRSIQEAKILLEEYKWSLPKWAYWSKSNYESNPKLSEYLRNHQMGWDVTDFGKNNFQKEGAVLFCIRNGNKKSKKSTTYCEKLLLLMPNQKIPFHFHKRKTEDIINKCNGVLELGLYASNNQFYKKKESFILNIDSKPTRIKPNTKIFLKPGQSITIKPYFCHYLKSSNKNKKNLIVGEVSSLNDDCCDNYFPDKNLRFSKIEEDEKINIPLWRELSLLF